MQGFVVPTPIHLLSVMLLAPGHSEQKGMIINWKAAGAKMKRTLEYPST